MIRIMATGTFDILHPGHLLYLEKSRALGDELVVIVARDVNVKHKPKPIVPEEQRLKMVSALKMVDLAFLGSDRDIFLPVKQLKPAIITLGFDQHFDPATLQQQLASRGLGCRIVKIAAQDPCELCSSRRIISEVRKRC